MRGMTFTGKLDRFCCCYCKVNTGRALQHLLPLLYLRLAVCNTFSNNLSGTSIAAQDADSGAIAARSSQQASR